ncbi:hypothetical protein B0T26DRAFT_414196 [Lasiosphaeria miniovina]|uniref:Uncharacterized protein n=1 Tax=Lasiosphaeria miniovina TaxID=1954250 RepID=A0AA40A5B4_9PEZI|nr:uncharacterized protein B0T26DRAFT_414196 [Lasiosphaeria miniovina]KAK0709616.1 hypothetical protein B0T26DRAFT_414196 [Lasiosphaeria miniovina]
MFCHTASIPAERSWLGLRILLFVVAPSGEGHFPLSPMGEAQGQLSAAAPSDAKQQADGRGFLACIQDLHYSVPGRLPSEPYWILDLVAFLQDLYMRVRDWTWTTRKCDLGTHHHRLASPRDSQDGPRRRKRPPPPPPPRVHITSQYTMPHRQSKSRHPSLSPLSMRVGDPS